jgi:hypothetical protein
MSESIIVYGDFTLNLKKYPRNGIKTDVIIITFLMHEEFLTKCAKSLDDAIKYFNGCKEYYYTYHSPDNIVKRYSAKEIIQFHNMISNNNIRNNNDYYNFIKNFQYIDQCYISYLRCRDFYMNLFKSIKNAKDAHFERRDYFYKVSPPMEIYGFMDSLIPSQIYSAYELMEIFTFTHYLKNHKIIKELPMPSFIQKINNENNNKYMKNLYNVDKIKLNNKNETKNNKEIKKKLFKINNKQNINNITFDFNNSKEETEQEDADNTYDTEDTDDADEEEEEKDEKEHNINMNLFMSSKDYDNKYRITNTNLWK